MIRAVAAAAGGRGYVAGLQALGRPIEDHLVLDPAGEVLDRPDPATEDPRAGRDRPLDPVWVEALGALLPLEATPLLADSMAGVWPALRVVWGPVPRDLIEERATTLRLSTALAAVYRAERARRPASARRALAQRLVREILGLLGSPVRRAAALWLEAQAAPRRAILLEEGAGVDRREAAARAAQPLQRLLDALEAGAALPA